MENMHIDVWVKRVKPFTPRGDLQMNGISPYDSNTTLSSKVMRIAKHISIILIMK